MHNFELRWGQIVLQIDYNYQKIANDEKYFFVIHYSQDESWFSGETEETFLQQLCSIIQFISEEGIFNDVCLLVY